MGHLWLRCQALFALLSYASSQTPQFVQVALQLRVTPPALTVRQHVIEDGAKPLSHRLAPSW